jgi:hypothetical protein
MVPARRRARVHIDGAGKQSDEFFKRLAGRFGLPRRPQRGRGGPCTGPLNQWVCFVGEGVAKRNKSGHLLSTEGTVPCPQYIDLTRENIMLNHGLNDEAPMPPVEDRADPDATTENATRSGRSETHLHPKAGGRQARLAMRAPIVQFCILRPGTRANSEVFAVTSNAPRRRACAVIRTSYGPMSCRQGTKPAVHISSGETGLLSA